MTPEAQRIAIAQAVPDGTLNRRDPLSDLNAMHDVEKVLTDEQKLIYRRELEAMDSHNPIVDWGLLHATAAQRAEAFLRTIGKWDENQRKRFLSDVG